MDKENSINVPQASGVEVSGSQPATQAHPPRLSMLYMVICLVVSISAGTASGWWFSRANTFEVYVVDVKKIVGEKKKELIEKYKQNPTDETIATADKDLSAFLGLLDRGITRLGDGDRKLVLLKDIYLAGDATDVTDVLTRKIKESGARTNQE
ncbi:MAG: hypothetical protein WCJ37_09900 [Syntrophus sp. (in: bacteria)]